MKIIKKVKYPLTIVFLLLITISIYNIKKNLNNRKYDIELSNNDNELIINTNDNLEIEEKDTIEKCNIDIKGAINNPGVYLVDCSSTVNDVINLAGGLSDNANTKVTNLAKKVFNEMVIIIYTDEEIKNSNIVDTVIKVIDKECNCPNIQNDSCINTEIKEEITNSNNDQSDKNSLVNINTATLSELQELDGIGESKAKAIIEYREKNGNFKDIEELLNVSGIGNSLYDGIKGKITV